MLYDVCRAKRKTYVHVVTKLGTELINEVSSDYMSADGVYERLAGGIDRDISENTEYTRTVNGTTAAITEQQYEQYQKQYLDSSDCIVEINRASWPTDGNHHASYQSVLSQLNAKASAAPAPAAGTYGPYMITGVMYNGSAYTVSLSAAKVEKKTVQMREHSDLDGTGGHYSPYQNETVTLVTIRPDTIVTVSGGDYIGVPVKAGYDDGNSKYTEEVSGAVQYIVNGDGKKSFECDNTPDWVRLDDHFIVVGENAAATSGFADIKAGAYYADAVKWAVDKGITNGTSAATFSPDSTCTVAQILTFLWHANGSPEPTVRNPFSDVSNKDYFYKAVVWAYEKGLIPDTGNFSGNSNSPCTRRMAAYFLWKLAGAPTSVPSGQYAVQNITAAQYSGEYRLKFSAAIVEETTITKHIPVMADDGDYNTGWRDESAKVTLVTMRPGSTVTVSPVSTDSMDNVPGNAYDISSDGKYQDLAWDIPLSMYTGAVENAFQYSLGDSLDYMGSLPTAMELTGKDGKSYMLRMAPVSTKFPDVPSSAAYAQAVAWSVSQGITAGTSDTRFSPNAACTRGQIVTFLYRAMRK